MWHIVERRRAGSPRRCFDPVRSRSGQAARFLPGREIGLAFVVLRREQSDQRTALRDLGFGEFIEDVLRFAFRGDFLDQLGRNDDDAVAIADDHVPGEYRDSAAGDRQANVIFQELAFDLCLLGSNHTS